MKQRETRRMRGTLDIRVANGSAQYRHRIGDRGIEHHRIRCRLVVSCVTPEQEVDVDTRKRDKHERVNELIEATRLHTAPPCGLKNPTPCRLFRLVVVVVVIIECI